MKANKKDIWVRQEEPFKATARIRETEDSFDLYLHEDGSDFVAIFETRPTEAIIVNDDNLGILVGLLGDVDVLQTSKGNRSLDEAYDPEDELIQELAKKGEKFFEEEKKNAKSLKDGNIFIRLPKEIRPLPWK